MTIIKRLNHDRKVMFDSGAFDEYCVYVVDEYNKKRAPRDYEYFRFFLELTEVYGNEKVYDDFLTIYHLTNRTINRDIRGIIDNIVSTYNEDIRDKVDENLSVIWGGMIAEENKDNTYLGKRVKNLGMYQVLKGILSPEDAAEFSRNKPWRELDTIMREYNI
jgi:hypothetical protein